MKFSMDSELWIPVADMKNAELIARRHGWDTFWTKDTQVHEYALLDGKYREVTNGQK